jgi:putative endonuclease
LTGVWGETAACNYLAGLGWKIVQRNFRTRYGEIDMIAQDGQYIVFVEVKTRRDSRFAAAREHVTAAKQRRILTAAEEWLQLHPTDLQPRFDVVEVYGAEEAAVPPRIHLIENAFGG